MRGDQSCGRFTGFDRTLKALFLGPGAFTRMLREGTAFIDEAGDGADATGVGERVVALASFGADQP